MIVTLAFINFPTMAGSDSTVIGALPWLIPIAVLAGLAFAAYLRGRNPALYDALEVDIERYDEIDAAHEVAEADARAAFEDTRHVHDQEEIR